MDLNTARMKTLSLILAGGRGSRLKQLTDNRSKPAVPIAGKYKIIDFPLSNCINSGMRKIAVLTQYRSHTLNQHVQRGWNFLRSDFNEFIELWPAQQQTGSDWYRGTADAVYQNLKMINESKSEYVLILAGDHVYKQDYSIMLKEHIESGADVSVACIEVPVNEADQFGIMHVDESDNIIAFEEKPSNPPTMPGNPNVSLASMGIYLFNAKFLQSHLQVDAESLTSSHDFGKDLIPYFVGSSKIKAHHFSRSSIPNENYPDRAYWRDVGTLAAYWESNMDLTKLVPELDLYDEGWPIRTAQYQRPAAKFNYNYEERIGTALNSVVSAGCIVSGSTVEQSILFNNVRVNSYSHVKKSVILPGCDIGRHCRLDRVIVDTDTKIPEGIVIGEDAALDAERFYRSSDGIVLVTQEMINALL
ncbi:glucose-1-phosphate adenylyltransferase [Marinomonas mediterranea]|jgi:glucose-1-phosphate adenylyltransferase|uniref:Glucose-1-phosphate adenylyltransferase n=1 Tax=Marinomonas mediterranea (strain ATCC 700492 / JCM 21426 / NBRC 103028 / MMB-1) TaxID=717774 RepID=F2JTF2_MARM1|nr:glucose-1-phosphate adenylyltransferase [Marinomonas mediterranea]ADZ90370.1 Glucose-1-phosphate adenylyltransferase [Marinomonas mediterranea MMB-1]WCN08426.1 glucose-1-phosphate adenylyltransferase [Marinomonas mediterranea]WCN12480.1 glucose-1-phosphate adenylyltransferase [Marinomonas mediterranea]WCN16552.1 glucose-1-phosphate adenylyltransferase [Marinomonas mediterranea MMB-1]